MTPLDLSAVSLTEAFRIRRVEPGEIIFLEGQPGAEAYVILNGEVQVAVHDTGGNFRVINRMPPGEMFGELAVLRADALRTATTLSNDGCNLLVIDKSIFDKHLAGADPLLRFIIDHLCRRIITLTDRARDPAQPEQS